MIWFRVFSVALVHGLSALWMIATARNTAFFWEWRFSHYGYSAPSLVMVLAAGLIGMAISVVAGVRGGVALLLLGALLVGCNMAISHNPIDFPSELEIYWELRQLMGSSFLATGAIVLITERRARRLALRCVMALKAE